MTSIAVNPSARPISSRQHSHSVSLGSVSTNYRITRRKSTIASATTNPAAIRAALKDIQAGDLSQRTSYRDEPHRRSKSEKQIILEHTDATGPLSGSAIADGFSPTQPVNIMSPSKQRVRRASEGSHLSKPDASGKKPTVGDLRCEKCGKGYKHSSCLYKHLWEHDPAWAVTSKLLISKHQQVQLLEAASVLVNMNQDSASDSDSPALEAHALETDSSSASPAASDPLHQFYDDEEARDSNDLVFASAETTPPPIGDDSNHFLESLALGRGETQAKLSSSVQSGPFSRSYQSAYLSAGVNNHSGFGNFYAQSPIVSAQPLQQRRLSTATVSTAATSKSLIPSTLVDNTSSSTKTLKMTPDEEDVYLAAAVETLCSFGTPRTGPLTLSVDDDVDIPPVPPLPARYVEEQQRIQHQRSQSGGALLHMYVSDPKYQQPMESAGTRVSVHASSYQPTSFAQLHRADPSPNTFALSHSYQPISNERGAMRTPDHAATAHMSEASTPTRTDTSAVVTGEDDIGVFGSMEGILS